MSTRTYDAESGDPHNDQLTMQARDDLNEHIEIVRDVLDQAERHDAPLSSAVAALAQNFIDQQEAMPRERLASLLALALIMLAAHDYAADAKDLQRFLDELTGTEEPS